MFKIRTVLASVAIMAAMSSCTLTNHTMREPNARVNWNRADFELSGQVSAEATTTRILGIDWARLFTKRMGSVSAPSTGITLASLPIIGNYLSGDKTGNYALYNMMIANPGYDVIFYPAYESTKTGIPILFMKTTVKAKARLAKLK